MRQAMKIFAVAFALVLASGFSVLEAGSCSSGTKHSHEDTKDKVKDIKATDASAIKNMDIVETAIGAGSFETLVTAVKAADLVEVLKGEGPFTVFAPTDEAFAKLPDGAVESLLKDKKKLASVLTYHVVPGKVLASDVIKLTNASTANGQEVSIEIRDEKVYVDGALVIKTDIECENGVIQIIDNVILPKMN